MNGSGRRVRPLRSWSNASLVAASAAIEPTWRRWCEEWGIAASQVVAMNACDEEARLMAPAWREFGVLPVASAWVGVATTVIDWVGTLIFASTPTPMGGTVGDQASLAHEVAEQAWRDLRSRLAAALTADLAEPGSFDDRSAPPMEDAARWSGALVMRLTAAGAVPPASLHLSFNAASRLVGGGEATGSRPMSATRALQPVFDAVGKRRMRISAELEGVVLDFATLASLRCGDVLPLPHWLDQPLRVRAAADDGSGASHDICSALLGARDGRRAVELICKSLTSDPRNPA